MRTLDEAISHEKRLVDIYKAQYECECDYYGKNTVDKYSEKNEIIQHMKEHEQIAEWLEELKAIKSDGFTDDLLNMGFTKGYNKAVDDFSSKLIMHFADWELSNAPFNGDETDGIGEIICETIENAIDGVKEIAEQLKAGER